MMKVERLVEVINQDCEDRNFFWVAGTIKETLPLWENKDNRDLLHPSGKIIAEKYLSR